MQRPFLRIFSSECRYKTLGKKKHILTVQYFTNFNLCFSQCK